MMHRTRAWSIKSRRGGLLVAVASSFFWLSSAHATDQSAEPSDQQITDFSLSGFGEKGKKSWDLSGKSADVVTDNVKMNQIVGNLYGEKENIKLTADKGNYNKVDGKVHLEDNVLVTTSSGAKLATNSLNWDRKNQVVMTKDPVNIERENIIATALGAIGQPDLSKVNLQKDVKVDIEQAPAGVLGGAQGQNNKITITCDGPLEIDYQKNVATFNKNVKVETQETMINSDVMEVYFAKNQDAESKVEASGASGGVMGSQVERIKAYGNVSIMRGENVSKSDEAVYSALDNKITLSGKPKLVIYSNKDMDGAFAQ